MYSVYVHTCPNGKKYVGMTGCENVNDRWGCGHRYKHDTDFYNAILEYGWKNISHEVVANCLSKDSAEELEKFIIKELKTTDPNYGYNSHSGGLKGAQVNEVTRQRMSKAQAGSNNPRYGTHLSHETKERIAASKRGKPLTEGCKQKLRELLSGGNNPGAKAVCQYTTEMELVRVWPCIRDAEREVGASNISTCCSGGLKTSGGYVWRYYEEVGGS